MADEPDMLLPIANVGRIMKQILPSNAKISKEAKQRIQECATEFICFVTGEASDKCYKENRKTVNGDDICWALSSLGFDQHSDATVRYLHRYREAERQKAKQSKRANSLDKDEESNSISCQKELQIEMITPSEFRFLEDGSSSSLAKPSQAYESS